MDRDDITSDDWRQLVGQAVEARRRELRLSKREAARIAGVSDALWRQMESGQRQVAPGVILCPNPRGDSRERVARALGWPGDAIDVLLGGGTPTPQSEGGTVVPFPSGRLATEDRLEDLERRLATLTDAFMVLLARFGVDSLEQLDH